MTNGQSRTMGRAMHELDRATGRMALDFRTMISDSEDSATFRWWTEMPYFDAMSTNMRPSQSSATEAKRSGTTPSLAQQKAAVTALPPKETA